MKLWLLLLAIPLAARTVTTATDTLTAADCAATVVYAATTQVAAKAPNLPAGCHVTLRNTGLVRVLVTVTELGMAETTFSVPKFPARTWILTTGKAADGSWFTSLKSQ